MSSHYLAVPLRWSSVMCADILGSVCCTRLPHDSLNGPSLPLPPLPPLSHLIILSYSPIKIIRLFHEFVHNFWLNPWLLLVLEYLRILHITQLELYAHLEWMMVIEGLDNELWYKYSRLKHTVINDRYLLKYTVINDQYLLMMSFVVCGEVHFPI